MTNTDIKIFLSSDWLASKGLDSTGARSKKLEEIEEKIQVTDLLSPYEVISKVLYHSTQNLVQKSNVFFNYEVSAAANMLADPHFFLDSPISCLFSTLDPAPGHEKVVDLFEYQFNWSHQKSDLLLNFGNYFRKFCDGAAILLDASLIIDELFTNAMYNAPDNNYENTRAGATRDEHEFEMRDQKFGKIFAGHHDSRLVIACEDPFGTLNVKKFLERIQACLVLGAETMMCFGAGGAGIGSYMLFTTSVSLYIGVNRNHKTVICCVLPLGVGNHKRNLMPKNIHYLELAGD